MKGWCSFKFKTGCFISLSESLWGTSMGLFLLIKLVEALLSPPPIMNGWISIREEDRNYK